MRQGVDEFIINNTNSQRNIFVDEMRVQLVEAIT